MYRIGRCVQRVYITIISTSDKSGRDFKGRWRFTDVQFQLHPEEASASPPRRRPARDLLQHPVPGLLRDAVHLRVQQCQDGGDNYAVSQQVRNIFWRQRRQLFIVGTVFTANPTARSENH